MKMKICYDHGYHDIRVVIVTKGRHYLFCLQPYFLAPGTLLLKPFTGAFPLPPTSIVVVLYDL